MKQFFKHRLSRELKRLARQSAGNGRPLSVMDDAVFKAVLASDNEDSREALRHLLSACIGREVSTVQVLNNEILPPHLAAKSARLDINLTFNDGMNSSGVLAAVYTINPGGETVATPTATPAGGNYPSAENVALATATGGASIYYTTNGTDPTTGSTLYSGPITISTTTTLKAFAVKSGMNNSEMLTAVYTITGTEVFENVTLGNGVTGRLEIPQAGNAALAIAAYVDPATIAAFSVPTDAASALSGKNVDVHIAGNSGGTVSLAYVHYLRAALTNAGATVGNFQMGGTIVPKFSSAEWWVYDGVNLYSTYNSSMANNTTKPLVNGIAIRKIANDNYTIEYSIPMQVGNLIYGYANSPYNGFAIKQLPGGSLQAPSNDWANVVIGDGSGNTNSGFKGEVANWATYISDLKSAGLYPENGILPVHNVDILAGGLANVMANGMYDFILAYYNPTSTGAAAPGTTDLKACLPSWPSNLTFNGSNLPAGLTSRNIGGITAAATERKASSIVVAPGANGANKTYEVGEPRADYIGNITVAMANYMRSIGIQTRFMNTNIIGDSGQWTDGNGVTINQGNSNMTLIPLNNVGLIGNYSSVNQLAGTFKGVIDIKGNAPKYIGNASISGYINLWNVSQNMGVNRFYVVSIKDQNGIGYVNKIDAWSTYSSASVVIYPKKYNPTAINGELSYLRPSYRAFMSNNDGTGTAGIMPVDATVSNIASYRGSVTSSGSAPSLYSLLESEWITAGNNDQNAASTVAYGAAPKVNTSNFETWLTSAAPAQTDTWLASMPRSVIEAVLTEKRRFGRA